MTRPRAADEGCFMTTPSEFKRIITPEEEMWTAPKLIGIGVVTLGIAFFILKTLSARMGY